ncbi:MAG: hypothetical protein EBV15_10520 [Bacteroidetes bacterium]|nr:hypothetical protein [Bacteroidota bacterium]
MKIKGGLIILLTAGISPLMGQSGRQFINLSDSKDFKGMQILDSVLQNKRLMVLGVNRYYPEITRTISIKFASYARNKAGYRYILAPVSPICGEWLNRFVSQNDFSVLKDLNLIMEPQDILLYKRLNILNEGVPDSLKIRVVGIDAENEIMVPALGIYNLLNDKIPPDRLRIPIEALQGAVRYQQIKKDTLNIKYNSEGEFQVNNTLDDFSRSFDTLQTFYQNWLGDDEWFRMEAMVRALKAAIYYESLQKTAMEDPYRVQQVSENIKKTMLTFPKERFVALIGRCFASKTWLQGPCQLYNFSPVCSKLSEDGTVGSQFFNIGVYYNEFADAEDEPQEIKSAIRNIRSGAPATSASLSLSDKDNASLPFNYMLVLGGNTAAKIELPDNLIPQINNSRNPRPLFSAGFNAGYHLVDIKVLSNLMAVYGLPEVDVVPDYGLNFSTGDRNNFLYQAGFFQRAKSPGSAYHYWGTYIATYGELYNATPWFKCGYGMGISYQQHSVNKPNTQSDTIFISRYNMPTRAVNPVLAMYLSAKGTINISKFYLSVEAGYGRDVSDSRWRVNNQYSGPLEKFNGNQLFLNITTGIHLITDARYYRKDNP